MKIVLLILVSGLTTMLYKNAVQVGPGAIFPNLALENEHATHLAVMRPHNIHNRQTKDIPKWPGP